MVSPTTSEGEKVLEIQSLILRARDLNQSVDRWNMAMIWALVFAAIAAIAVVVATRLVLVRTKQLADVQEQISGIKEAEAKVEQGKIQTELAAAVARAKEADARIAEAQRDSAEAHARATKAQESLGLAEQHSAEANAKAEGFRLDIAQSNERAAQANRIAEQERLARLQLEARLADRVLTPEQQRKLTSAAIPLKGKTIDVSVFGDTPEIMSFSGAVLNCLRQAGWLVNTSNPMGGGSYARGVLIGTKPGSPPEFTRFADVFIAILQETVGSGVGRWDFDKLVFSGGMAAVSQAIGADQLGTAPIRLFIGSK